MKTVPHLVYIHVGKTAGTSLRGVLADAFGPGKCSPPFVQSYMTAQEAQHYRDYRVICGHISRADQLRWFPDRSVITILREPIDRCLSFIGYVKSLSPESSVVAADAHRLPVLALVETEEAQRDLNNTMVRKLGGHMIDGPTDLPKLLECAKQTLIEALWVGRQHVIGTDLTRLASLLGVQLGVRHDNITPDKPSYHAQPPELLNRLYALNGYDLQLWTWAQEEIFDNVLHWPADKTD